MDISHLCRSCMQNIESKENTFNSKVAEMFCYCTKIKILNTPDDLLPKQFCQKCIRNIEFSYDFIQEAQRVDVALKNIVSRSTTVIVEPENFKSDHNHLKLTLPDYKISATVNDSQLKDNIEDADFDHCCESTLNNEIQLDNIDKLDEINSKKYTCPVCQKCFTSKLWYSRHIEKEQGKKFNCPYCSKSFLISSQLSYHIIGHSLERRFVCNTCGKKFKRQKQLAVHTRSHTDIRPYGCDKCDMRFKIKSVLKCHMKVHEDQKQYLCSFCGWSFSQAGNLEVHIRKHTGDKPFKCPECPFRASVASNLRRHERRHNGAKTHVCHHCRKGFYDAGSLARHTRTHTGELPYKCPGCERAFVDSWKRKTHLMRTHRMKLQDIPRMTRDGRTIDK